jgi:phenylpropionate dioxygenase-like ring-hydroxylating dioxygenase large terminal subunit
MFNDYWYLICPERELVTGKIKSVSILGQNIILFRTKKNEIVALEDRCCHRNVQLSLGFLKNDRIVCGYHGWEYDSRGICQCIPSQNTESKIPPTAKIKSYPVKIYNRWLWLFMGKDKKGALTSLPDIPEMQQWPYVYQSYNLKADLAVTAESLIDPYHIAFVHRDTIGFLIGQIKEDDPEFNLEILPDGVRGKYRRKNVGHFIEKLYFGNRSYYITDYRFFFPNLSYIKINFDKRILLIIEHVVPVSNNILNMIQITLWDNIFKGASRFAHWFMQRKSDAIVKEDLALLESHLQYQSQRDISVKGDRISLAFRQFWRKKENQQGNNA